MIIWSFKRKLLQRSFTAMSGFQGLKFGTSAAMEYAILHTHQPIQETDIVAPPVVDLAVPSQTTLVELIRSVIRPWAHKIAFECAVTGVQLTHNEVFKYSRKFGAALYQAGFRRGDVVGILHSNSPYFAVAFYGLLEAGFVANLLSPLIPPERLGEMMAETRTQAVVTSPDLAPEIIKIKECTQGNQLRLVISTGEDQLPTGCHSFKEMLKFDDTAAIFPTESDFDFEQDPALIFWSSGTTGRPKPVLHTHKSVLSQSLQALHPSVNVYNYGEDTVFCTVPFYHAYGNTCLLRLSSLTGVKVVTMPKFSPSVFKKCLREYKPAVITMNAQLIDYCGVDETIKVEDLQQTRAVKNGGARISSPVRERFQRKFGHDIFIQNLYGTSEAGLTHVMPLSHANEKAGSFGQLLPDTYAKIVDSDGNALKAGSVGELLIIGPQMMKGYMNKAEGTNQAVDSAGWIHTGDICYCDDDGFFFITDRIKDIIKVKGLQVSPSLLESYLNMHPKIKESVVIGIPDQRAGELPKAFVVARDPNLSEKEIHEFLENKLAKHEQLKGGIVILDAIPKDPIGKIQKHVLKNL